MLSGPGFVLQHPAEGGAQAAVLGDQQDYGQRIHSNDKKDWGDRVSEADKHVLIQQTNNDGPFSSIFCDIYENGIWLRPITDSERVGTFPFTFEPLFIPYGEIIEVKAAKQGHKLRRSGYKGMGDAMGRSTYQCLTILTRNPTRLGLTDKKHQKTKIRLGFMETGVRDQWLTGINEAKAKAPVADVAERSDASAVRNDLAQNPWVQKHMLGLWYRNVYKRRDIAIKYGGIARDMWRPDKKADKELLKLMQFGASDKYYIRDDMTQCCLVCFDPFNTTGFFQRSGKHHCRMCGFVVCKNCLSESSLMGWPYYYDKDNFEYRRTDDETYEVCTKCRQCLKANQVADANADVSDIVAIRLPDGRDPPLGQTQTQDPDSLLCLTEVSERKFAIELNRGAEKFGSPIKYEWDKNNHKLDPVLFVLSLAYEDPWIGDEQLTIRRYHGAKKKPLEFTDTRWGLIQSIIKSTDLLLPQQREAAGGQAAAAPQPLQPEPQPLQLTPVSSRPVQQVKMRYNFEPKQKGQGHISVKKGDILNVIPGNSHPGWINVSVDGRSGYVPNTHIYTEEGQAAAEAAEAAEEQAGTEPEPDTSYKCISTRSGRASQCFAVKAGEGEYKTQGACFQACGK